MLKVCHPYAEQGKHMKEARERKGMTGLVLAKRAGITNATLSKLETGRSGGNLQAIIGLADILGIPIDEYIGHKPKKGGDA